MLRPKHAAVRHKIKDIVVLDGILKVFVERSKNTKGRLELNEISPFCLKTEAKPKS